MKYPRFKIASLMMVVAFVALNSAIVRLLFATRRMDVLVGGILLSLLLQWAILRAYRQSGRKRAFWAGFLGGGLAATLAAALATAYPRSAIGMMWGKVMISVLLPLGRILEAVAEWTNNAILTELLGVAAEVALIWIAPAVLAGLFFGILARRFGTRTTPQPKVA
jgi:hypothetical protein